MKKFNAKLFMKDLLKNKWVLNIVAFIALLNLLSFIIVGNINSTIFFVVLALLIRYFSKNMIIVLGIPIIFVNLFSFKTYREGLETSDASGASVKVEKKESKNEKKEEKDEKTSDPEENFEVGRAKNKGANKIDYATTIEDAYDDLNKILGSDGIKRLTDDTQHLMKQQMNLAKSMESMTPLIENMLPMAEKAQQLMASMDKKTDGLGNIMEMAKNLSGGLMKTTEASV